MPVASLPSPASGLWNIGPLAVHGYALCVALGAVAAIWVAEQRYRRMGGARWLIVDLAAVVVPVALIGARLDRVVTNYQQFFGAGADWTDIFRIWDGGLGLPGAAAAALVVAWYWCRRRGAGFGAVLTAAAPGFLFAQAIAVWSNWFNQTLYGAPSGLPWAMAVSPGHRAPGYQSFATFQPLFLYESVWDILAGLALIYLIRRLALTGGRALVIAAALDAIGRLAAQSLRIGGPAQLAGVRFDQLALIGLIGGAVAYLYTTRSRRGPEPLSAAQRVAPPPAVPAESGARGAPDRV